MSEQRDVIAAADAAKVLGVSRQRVHALFREGLLPGVVRYKHLYLDADAVRARAEATTKQEAPEGKVTVNDIALVLGVAPATVRQYHKRGLLKGGVKENGRLLFPANVLDGFVKPVVGLSARRQPWNAQHRRPPMTSD